MKEFLTIKEFSKLSGIEQTTLRYWDDIGLFSPTKRDPENNYRYYTAEQIVAVNFIKVLSEINIPLKTISGLEQERTPEAILELIDRQEKGLDMEMRRLRECYSIMHARRELINYGVRLNQGFRVVDSERIDTDKNSKEGEWVDTTAISILYREEKVLILGPRNNWETNEPFYECFMKFCNMALDLRINLSFPIGGYHEDLESFVKSPGQPDRFFSLDPTGNRKREAGKYVTGFSRGYYGDLDDVSKRLGAYIKDHSLKVQGPVYTIYLLDEICTAEPGQYLAQIGVAVS